MYVYLHLVTSTPRPSRTTPKRQFPQCVRVYTHLIHRRLPSTARQRPAMLMMTQKRSALLAVEFRQLSLHRPLVTLSTRRRVTKDRGRPDEYIGMKERAWCSRLTCKTTLLPTSRYIEYSIRSPCTPSPDGLGKQKPPSMQLPRRDPISVSDNNECFNAYVAHATSPLLCIGFSVSTGGPTPTETSSNRHMKLICYLWPFLVPRTPPSGA